jgi:hypothetical protein
VGANTKGAWAYVRRCWTMVLMHESIHALIVSQHIKDRIGEAGSAHSRRVADNANGAHRETTAERPAKRRRWRTQVKPT